MPHDSRLRAAPNELRLQHHQALTEIETEYHVWIA